MRAQASGRGLHNVPAELTSFVGRRHELVEIKQRLGASRLVTLTGPGGVGKTRLALRVAAEVARAFPDGVWFVPLAPIDDPQLMTQAVFHSLGLQDRSVGWSLSALTDYLADKHQLLILDNCEHLVDSCAVLATTLLKSCPELRLLATSRQPLGTAGEARLRVPSLSLPDDGALLPAERLVTFEAVALLVERAAAVMPDFRVDQTNATDVLKLCRRLDGIPLALELAAGRLEGLSLTRLNQGLDAELAILAGANRGAEARQRTLEATIGWSYGLLDEDERRLWARLSVFAGSFDEEAAAQVCSDSALSADRVIELLAALVEKSIVKRDVNLQPARYELLETLRQYGRVRLRELGEEILIQARHRDWIRTLTAGLAAWDSRQADLFSRIYLERDNVWAALEFCLRHPGEVSKGAEICQDLWFYWVSRGPCGDARRVVMSLLALTSGDSLPHARLLLVAASVAAAQNDLADCRTLSERSLRLAQDLGNSEVAGWSLIWQGLARLVQGETTVAMELAESAISLGREMQIQPVVLNAMGGVCNIRFATGDLDAVVKIGEEALALSLELGEIWQRGYLLNFLSQASWQQGDLGRAEEQAREGLACKHALDDRHGLSIVVETLAWMAAERAEYQRAATLQGCAERLRETAGTAVMEQFRAQHEHAASVASEGMGAAAFMAAVERGTAMTIDEIAAYALEQKPPAKPLRGLAAESGISLTRREQEIAALVAQGLSNKQIAAKLVVSERTAESHILNILNKLGFNSRSQIAAWAAAHQPSVAAPRG